MAYRYSSQLEGDFPSVSDFPAFYTAHHALLHSSAWRSYYSTAGIAGRRSRGGPGGRAGGTSALWCAV
jgi:hypothetical protein